MVTLRSTGMLGILLLCAATTGYGETVDEKLKRLEAEGVIELIAKEDTRDACDKNCTLIFTSTTDGPVEVKPGEMKYFKIKPIDDYTRSGGYYWTCCGYDERSRMRGAVYVQVVRKADTGAFTQYRIEIQVKP